MNKSSLKAILVIILIPILLISATLLINSLFNKQETFEQEETFAALKETPPKPQTINTTNMKNIRTGVPISEDTKKLAEISLQTQQIAKNRPSTLQKQREALEDGTTMTIGRTGATNTETIYTPITQKILVIIWNSKKDPEQIYHDPRVLVDELARSWELSSIENRFAPNNYQNPQNIKVDIVEVIENNFRAPQKPGTPPIIDDGISGAFDYERMLKDYKICDRINKNQIDEVWLYADKTGGFWEATMAGPKDQIFWTNSSPIITSNCNRAVHIMGFNYQVWTDDALHSLGHRTESILSTFLDKKSKYLTRQGDTSFELLGQYYDPNVPNRGYVGNTHYPPNVNKAYDYDIKIPNILSDYFDWNPQHSGQKKPINCEAWNCNQYDYQVQWFQHIPGRCTSPILKKTNGQPMPNMWIAILKNQYFYEQSNCKNITFMKQFLAKDGSLWARNNKNGWSRWENVSGNVSETGTGDITSFSVRTDEYGIIQQFLVKTGNIWYRDNKNGWSKWSNITDTFKNVGTGNITAFATLRHPDNYIQQYLTKNSRIWYRDNKNGWSKWQDITKNVDNVGTGNITSFTTAIAPDGNYIVQYLSRGDVLWSRNNKKGWSKWQDVTKNIDNVGTKTKSLYTFFAYKDFYIDSK